jgi:hypothetical protein
MLRMMLFRHETRCTTRKPHKSCKIDLCKSSSLLEKSCLTNLQTDWPSTVSQYQVWSIIESEDDSYPGMMISLKKDESQVKTDRKKDYEKCKLLWLLSKFRSPLTRDSSPTLLHGTWRAGGLFLLTTFWESTPSQSSSSKRVWALSFLGYDCFSIIQIVLFLFSVRTVSNWYIKKCLAVRILTKWVFIPSWYLVLKIKS